ncbi:hypothetical protein NP493_509g02003 [Ridgeia piscesae]|uniref:G-protein coupled receptors family 1 profile domain-containing protein n=1 Tax=Ridgeia piscesae TaxID=27915 RepID=A0AAD9KYC7_RIDPI|nr:hypothetical protein NP493_509g02003 [Ridgeia piscesae]
MSLPYPVDPTDSEFGRMFSNISTFVDKFNTTSTSFHDYPCEMLGLTPQIGAAILPSLRFYLYASTMFVISGLIGNSLSVLVFSSREMRGISSNVYLLLLAISDSLYLLSVFLTKTLTTIRCLYFPNSAADIFNRSTTLCKLLQHTMDMFSDYSTCLILAFTIERYIAIYLPIRFKSLCSVRRARIACATIFIAVCIFIAPYHIMYIGLFNNYNVCTVLDGFETVFTALYIVEALVFRVIPVFVIALLNGMIIVRVTKLRRRKRKRNASMTPASQTGGHSNNRNQRTRKADKSMQLTIILVLVSTSYILVFIPVLVHFVLWKMRVSNWVDISDLAMLTSQNYTRTLYISGFAINFFLYTMSGRIFREQLEKIVCDTQRRDRSTVVTSVEATSVL